MVHEGRGRMSRSRRKINRWVAEKMYLEARADAKATIDPELREEITQSVGNPNRFTHIAVDN